MAVFTEPKVPASAFMLGSVVLRWCGCSARADAGPGVALAVKAAAIAAMIIFVAMPLFPLRHLSCETKPLTISTLFAKGFATMIRASKWDRYTCHLTCP